MSETTRRGFVRDSAAAAAGMTVIGALLAEQAEAHASGSTSRPLIAYVRNVRKGEIWVMAGDRDVRLHDRKLAAQIARAAQHHHHRTH